MFGVTCSCWVGILAFVLAQQPTVDEDLPPLPRIDYGTPAGPTYIGLQRGDKLWLGALDAAGNFVPDYRAGWLPIGGHSAAPRYIGLNTMLSANTSALTYEHRSGRLIKGVLVPDGSFVPELGSRVTELKDFSYDPDQPLHEIYNLPDFKAIEALIKKARERDQTIEQKTMPRMPAPPKARVPASYDYQAYSTFRDPPAPWVAHVRGRTLELGRLNDAGDFLPEYDLPPIRLAQPWADSRRLLPGERQLLYYNLPKSEDKEPIYEYRSGRLLQGTLLKNGTFVPDADSKVLDFGDYKPADPKARRIYNLPGELVKKR